MTASKHTPAKESPASFIEALQAERPAEIIRIGRQLIADLNQNQLEHFQAGEAISRLMRERSLFIDQLLKQLWKHFLQDEAEHTTLVAVGGYGREEMQPYSDVDILVLHQGQESINEPLSQFFTLLWDLGLDLGHAVRTVEECYTAGLEDIVTATNLLEARWITGNYELFEHLQALWQNTDFWPSEAFFHAKRHEQTLRHERYHDTLYQLEPNVKESPGGLRDIQTLFWVAKRHFNASSINDLVRFRFITSEEFQELESSYYYLNRIRFALHILKKRHEDRLLFENQQKVAEMFGYQDSEEKLAVEQFMSTYYRAVQISTVLNEILLQHFQEALLPSDNTPPISVNAQFEINHQYLDLKDPNLLQTHPSTMFGGFIILEYLSDQVKGFRSRTIRAIRSQLHLIDEHFRNDPINKAQFIEILRQPKGVYASLKRMHTYGILGAYIPAFHRISGLMQFNIFHAYTVDEHTILVIRNMRRFFVDEYSYEFPTAHKIAKHLCKPELLFLAGLFHDIAKGRGGRHEILGAEEALSFCQSHNLPPADSRLVSWLVRHHLDFSDFAQKRDLSDPEEIAEFAKIVKSPSHLDYLYLLTLADVISTSDGVWNDWKNALFLQLYRETANWLDNTSQMPKDRHKKALQNQEIARETLHKQGLSSHQYAHLWRGFEKTDFFSRQTPQEIVRLTQQLYQTDFHGMILNFEPETHRGASELMLFMPDRDFLFADITAIIDKHQLTIVEAKIYANYAQNQNMTLVMLYLLNAHHQQITDPNQIEELLSDFQHILEQPNPTTIPCEQPIARRIRCFDTPTEITFEDRSQKYTQLHLKTKDVPGILYQVATVFKQSKIRMHDAKIHTVGEKAEDTFLISNLEGKALTSQQKIALKAALIDQLGTC